MNRRLLIRVAIPAILLGVVLCGTCLVTAWYIYRLESNLSKILSQNVASLQAAQELEIRVRQLRNHTFIYLIEPTPLRLEPIETDQEHFETALQHARESASTPEEEACVQLIQVGYRQYRGEMADLREGVLRHGPRTDFGKLYDEHPIRHVTEPCQTLLRLNKQAMNRTAAESNEASQHANLIVLMLGLGAPVGGIGVGYVAARRFYRSIYRLSVQVQDMARHLDQKVASMSVVVDGDIENLDRQMQYVVGRVEETAKRLHRQQHEMLRAEQLAAVGQVAASVAHEVRNPLTSVKILVEAALRPENTMPITSEDLQIIHEELARVENTVQTFLHFARMPKPYRQECDVRAIITQAVDLIRARARQQGVAIVRPEPPVASGNGEPARTTFADPGQLGTVLVNLCLNALDAMPSGGTLEIALDSLAGQGTRISVSDTGTGIAPEIADRLFTPFTSTKAIGTGLGLSISQRIVEEHGGSITARNLPERGACFTITLLSTTAAPGTSGSDATRTTPLPVTRIE